jgi:hypothetical protein
MSQDAPKIKDWRRYYRLMSLYLPKKEGNYIMYRQKSIGQSLRIALADAVNKLLTTRGDGSQREYDRYGLGLDVNYMGDVEEDLNIAVHGLTEYTKLYNKYEDCRQREEELRRGRDPDGVGFLSFLESQIGLAELIKVDDYKQLDRETFYAARKEESDDVGLPLPQELIYEEEQYRNAKTPAEVPGAEEEADAVSIH